MRRLRQGAEEGGGIIELADGSRYLFDPEKVHAELFLYWAASLRAEAGGELRPEPPEILKAVARARDREKALRSVYPAGVAPWMPLDTPALIEHGDLVPRPLVSEDPSGASM